MRCVVLSKSRHYRYSFRFINRIPLTPNKRYKPILVYRDRERSEVREKSTLFIITKSDTYLKLRKEKICIMCVCVYVFQKEYINEVAISYLEWQISLLSKREIIGSSLVVQWLRICLPMQGMRV